MLVLSALRIQCDLLDGTDIEALPLVTINIITSNKNVVLDIGMEKEQKQELGWRVSVLPIPAFYCTCNT